MMNSLLQIEKPYNFRLREVLIINAIGAIPGCLLGACGVGSIFLFVIVFLFGKYILIPFALLAFSIAGTVLFFWPAVLGNPYVRNIVKKSYQPTAPTELSIICQASFTPRVHGGFRGFMEDADDVGHLDISNNSLSFVGDHVQFLLPSGCIEELSHSNSGWRGLWVTGQRIKLSTNALQGYESVEFLERQSYTLRSAKSISREMVQKIKRMTQQRH